MLQTNTIYQGDCRELLNSIEDKSVDISIIDPPYGMEYLSNHYKYGNPHSAIVGDDKYPVDVLETLFKKTRKAVFSFCRWDNLGEVPKPKSFIVWAKNNWSAGDLEHEYGRSWEGILFYPLEDHKFNERPNDVFDGKRVPSTSLLHPTEKPLSILKWLIEKNTEPGDVVLDCFAGSGSTLVSAEQTGRKFIGIEIEKKYCDIAKSRLGQTNLFFQTPLGQNVP